MSQENRVVKNSNRNYCHGPQANGMEKREINKNHKYVQLNENILSYD